MFRFSNAWTTDVVEAKTLAMFAYMLRARRVVEVGMFTGYGALTIAEALPSDAKMISLEVRRARASGRVARARVSQIDSRAREIGDTAL